MATQDALTSVEYLGQDSSSQHVFRGWTTANKPKLVRTHYNPNYFFVLKTELQDVKNVLQLETNDDIKMISTDALYAFGKKPVVQLEFSNDVVMKEAHSLLEQEEIDALEFIDPVRRFRIDKALSVPNPLDVPVVSLDIEVDARVGFPQHKNPIQRIIGIAFTGSDGFKEFVSYDDEEKIFNESKKILSKYRIATGWNLDGFDKPYLNARAKLLDIDFHVPGVSYVDAMKLYKYTEYARGKSARLDDTAKRELDREIKKEFESLKRMEAMYESFVKKDGRLKEYCLDDAQACYDIFTSPKLQLTDMFLYHVVNIASCDYSDSVFPSRLVESTVLKKAQESTPRIIFPSEHSFNKNAESFEGGRVIDPSPGLWDWVVVFDFKSLYNRVMQTWNIGLDSYVDPADRTIDGQYIKSPTGAMYSFSPSVYRNVLRELEIMRNVYKTARAPTAEVARMYKTLNNSYKMILLSVWGVLGQSSCRLFSRPIAESIAGCGRYCLTLAEEFFKKELGCDVKYGDSVSGDTVVPFKINGRMTLLRMDEFLTNVKCKETKWDSKQRYVPNDTVETLSHNYVRGVSEWKRVNRFIVHTNSKSLKTYRTPRGVCTVTDDHSLIARDGQTFTLAGVKDHTRIVDMQHIPYNVRSSELLDGSIKQIDLAVYAKCYKKLRPTITDTHIRVDYSMTAEHTIRKSKILPRYVSLDADFGWLLGFYIAEGSLGRVTSNEVMVRDEFCKRFEKIFGRALYKRNDQDESIGDCDIIHIGNKIIAKMFEDLCGKRSAYKHLPRFFMQTTKAFVLSILEGYTFGDGCRCDRSDNYEDTLIAGGVGSRSRLLVSQVYFLLTCVFGFIANDFWVKYRRDKDFYSIQWNKRAQHTLLDNKEYKNSYAQCRVTERSDTTVYDLSVEGNENFVDACGMFSLHNTDSLMVSFKGVSDPNTLISSIIPLATKRVNEFLKQRIMQECNIPEEFYCIEIECEKVYDKYYIPAKKRYIGRVVWKEGVMCHELFTRGFEIAKFSAFELYKVTQKKVFDIVFRADNTADIIRGCDAYFNEIKEQLFAKKVDDQLVVRSGVHSLPTDYKSNQPYITAAKKLVDMGMFRVGDVVKYVITHDGKEGLDADPIIGDKLPNISHSGYLYYWNRLATFRDDLLTDKGGIANTKLTSFFSEASTSS